MICNRNMQRDSDLLCTPLGTAKLGLSRLSNSSDQTQSRKDLSQEAEHGTAVFKFLFNFQLSADNRISFVLEAA